MKGNRKRGSPAEDQLPRSLYPPYENTKIEGGVREGHQKSSGEVGNQQRTIDGTNNMRDTSKKPN